jgi:membrane-anchored protein YejM (alkaline phosphatase superfamily)
MQTMLSNLFQRKNPAINFFISFLILCICYRCAFFLTVVFDPFTLLKKVSLFSCLTLGFLDDLALGMLLTVFFMLVQIAFRRIDSSILGFLGKGLLCLFLTFLALDFFANKKVFFFLYTGCSWNLFMRSLQQGFMPGSYLHYMNLFDWIFLLLPGSLFLYLENKASFNQVKIVQRAALTSMLIAIALGLAFVPYNNKVYFKEFYSNPLHYAFSIYLNPEREYYASLRDQPGDQQMHSLRLIDPAFVENKTLPAVLADKPAKKWNVVMIVMESVGQPYVFHSKAPAATTDVVTMPFLKKLSTQGWWLDNNYSGGNTSLLGVFSLLTGVYPSASPNNFEMHTSIHVPTLAAWLAKNYSSLFVMADDISYFFQRSIVENGGFQHIYDATDIIKAYPPARVDYSANEPEAVSFFLNKMGQLHAPFLAVYWSNVTHYPYLDYGKPRLFSDVSSPTLRYFNNLRLADNQIERIYRYLETNKLLADTLLVIVSDHGDGFGLNPGDWAHGAALYQDQIHVPALFYQPALFKPRVISDLTSNVDILPTLLDAMGADYNKSLLQGESLWAGSQRHKYVFIYGNEYELAIIDKHNLKTQIDFIEGKCVFHDLNKDPAESVVAKCSDSMEESALIKFHNFQPLILTQYNQSLLNNCAFLPATDMARQPCQLRT